ncbi:helix-turn-helix domain-containing protein [Furfurilactobacillus sp. WILCCON 0119]
MFPERLKQLRHERRGLTQESLADQLGIAKTTYSSYEQGKREPDFNTLQRLASYFDVSTDYLLGNSPARQEVDLDKPGAILRYNGKPIPPEDLELIKRLIRGARDGHE